MMRHQENVGAVFPVNSKPCQALSETAGQPLCPASESAASSRNTRTHSRQRDAPREMGAQFGSVRFEYLPFLAS
jgi:hypothetical protein